MSSRYHGSSEATVADPVNLPPSPPQSPILSPIMPLFQDGVHPDPPSRMREVLTNETREIIHLFIEHACLCFVLTTRILALPLTILLCRLGFFQRSPLTMAWSDRYSRNRNINPQSRLTWMIMAFWTYAAEAVKGLIQLCHRIERVTTLLERHLDEEDTANHESAREIPFTDVQPVEVRGPETVSSSQMYHAALTDDTAFDKALASFDGGRSLPYRQSSAIKSDTYLEANSAAQRTTTLWTDLGSSPPSNFEASEKIAKFSVTTSPTWLARLGYNRTPRKNLTTVTEASRFSDNNDLFCHGSVRSSSLTSKPKLEDSPTIETARCLACDQTCSDSDQSVIRRRKSEEKQTLDSPRRFYHTVPSSKGSSIPKMVRTPTKKR